MISHRRTIVVTLAVASQLKSLTAFNHPRIANCGRERGIVAFDRKVGYGEPSIAESAALPSLGTFQRTGEQGSSSRLFASTLPSPGQSPVFKNVKVGQWSPKKENLREEEPLSVWSDGSWTQNKMTASETIQSLLSIVQASFLLTGNTVGAGMMVLPDIAREAGLGVTVPLVLGLYVVNMISGILISDVAIKQYEAMGKDSISQEAAPSSFMQLTESALGKNAGTAVSSISLFVNWAVLAFALMETGQFLEGVLPMEGGIASDAKVLSVVFSGVVALLVSISSNDMLSKFTSAAVMVLFGSFACLLVPGLMHMQDPLSTLSTPGTYDGSMLEAVLSAAPIFLSTLVFQNMVPLLSKMLDYDRFKVTTTMAIGSGIPMMMYLAWCLASLGGGVDSSSITGGPLVALFSGATLVASGVTGAMSLAEELQKVMPFAAAAKEEEWKEANRPSEENVAPVPSVLLAVVPPLIAGILFSNGEGFTSALSCAGGYGSPILYGLLPVALSWAQDNKTSESIRQQQQKGSTTPGGIFGLGALCSLSVGFVAQQVAVDFPSLFSVVS